MTRPQLRVIVADDEPLARQALRRFLAADGDVTIVAEAEDLSSLRHALASHGADVLFLDITMPGGSGMDVLPVVAAELDDRIFLRVHRSHVVNLAHVSRVVPHDERRLAAEFADGSRVVCSRAGSASLRTRARLQSE